jgi:deoxyribonuclease-1-like protein
MKKLLFIFLVLNNVVLGQTILSWNIANLGETKYKKDTILPIIVKVLKESKADIIAIQEVVVNTYGDSCIIFLAKKLNYNYIISKKTTGEGTERYAYLYNKTIKMNYNHLDTLLQDSIDREPYIASFTYNKKEIIIRQIHTVPTSKNPEYEISKLKYTTGIICGDFNLTDEHLIFIPLLKIFESPLLGKPTTLKKNGDLSKNSYDHFLINKKIKFKFAAVMEYNYKYNKNLISDHLPIMLIIN